MFPEYAPKHCARIKELVRAGFYDGLTWHRVIPGFMAQGAVAASPAAARLPPPGIGPTCSFPNPDHAPPDVPHATAPVRW